MNAPQAQTPDIASTANTVSTMQAVLQKQRKAIEQEGIASAAVRKDRLHRAIALLFDNRDRLVESISADFGHRSAHQTLMSDIFATLETLKYTKKNLEKWMKPEKRSAGMPYSLFGARARVEYQPLGVVGVLGTWNFPVNTVFAPLAGILAAGNRALLKYSEITPATGQLLNELINEFYDDEEICGFNGGPDVGAAFSALPLDHLIFTGATGVGKHILKAAADNLTPVTLELGGKSPVIISRSADLKEAALRIISGKILNMGQVCLSPDYLLVHEQDLDVFMTFAEATVKQMFPKMLANDDYTSVVNERHFKRLLGLIQDAIVKRADVRQINPAQEDFSQQQGTHKLPFTFVVKAADDMAIMQEEIFGPLLCVKTYRDISECIDYINAHGRPLGMYYFGKDKNEQRRVLEHTRSGGVTINDVIMHVSCEDLPFGGVGPSGMGKYHGIDGFKTFSHARAIYQQSPINLSKLGGMLPPYGAKCDKTLASMIKPD